MKNTSENSAASPGLGLMKNVRRAKVAVSRTPQVSASPKIVGEARAGLVQASTPQMMVKAAVRPRPITALVRQSSRAYSAKRRLYRPEPYTVYVSRMAALCKPERSVKTEYDSAKIPYSSLDCVRASATLARNIPPTAKVWSAML